MRKPYLIIAVVVAVIGAYQLSRKEPLYHTQSYIFGTLVDISIYDENEDHARAVSNQILQDFQTLHNRLHAWKPISEGNPSDLGKINMGFERNRRIVNVNHDVYAMLADSKNLSIKSNGLFNPAIGHLISAWGFQRDEFSPVSVNERQIKKLVDSNPNMNDIVLEHNTAYSKNRDVKLDLGGYAKGYALDVANQYLRKEHVNNALINIGGNIIAIGQHGDKPWRVGIQHPRAPTAIATIDLPDGWGVGTSGDYQRYFMLNGKRYCHIIDPRTGYPAQHTQSVTVLVPPQPINQTQAGVLSDVASKPIFIELPQNRSKAAQALGIQNFMLIDDNANIFVSKQMVAKLNWLSPNVKFTTLP